ncbi:MAG: glycine cleavage system aminomethyltransferase GcvT [Gemmatimonadota bacterium]
MTQLKHTPLAAAHVALGAKMVPFAGFEMPVQYPTGIRREHQAVREAAGLFDVSHMGEFLVDGPDAEAFVSRVTTNDPGALRPGQAQYSAFCRSDGGIVDDLLVYRLADDCFRLVVNAANIDKDWAHIQPEAASLDVALENESDRVGLIALQGPASEGILQPLVMPELDRIGYYEFAEGEVAGAPALISRTGYTGEDGFELYVPTDRTGGVWRALLDAGTPSGLTPAGLGARDSLRLEMGYALYGNDIDDGTSPLEARLGWIVKLQKGAFTGREALLRQKEAGVERRLTGFRLTERGFPRPGCEVVLDGDGVAPVRSGTVSPTLGHGIGTAYLPPDRGPGDPLVVRIRGRDIAGEVCRTPFYEGGSLRR